MKAGRGKVKGGAFERAIALALSLWITRGKKRDVFWRSAMSGGRATVARKRGHDLQRQAGDISAVAPEGHIFTSHYFVECKHYKDLQIDNFMLLFSGPLARFWKKTAEQAHYNNLVPVLIAKQNMKPTILITENTERARFDHKARSCSVGSLDVYLFDAILEQPFKSGTSIKRVTLGVSACAKPSTRSRG